MSDNEGGQINSIDILISEGWMPTPQRMIVVKRLANGDIHAEDDEGQMIIVRTDGTVKTFLGEDTDWVTGRISDMASAWEIVGFYLGMTNGAMMERARGERTN